MNFIIIWYQQVLKTV